MRATVRALFERIIDYAGLFPPARLPLADALQHYMRLLATPERWMLGRFVCPAARLAELWELCRSHGEANALRVAALGRGGSSAAEFDRNLVQDLADVRQFRQASGRSDAIDVFECAWPAQVRETDHTDLLERTRGLLQAAHLQAFFEIPVDGAWQKNLTAFSESLSRAADAGVGLKLRCGGAIVPTPVQVAFFLCRCRDLRLPCKATAGLHHPLRHLDSALQTKAHGFLNVFGAGILSRIHPLDADQVEAIVSEESFGAFRFEDDRFGWREWSCSASEVEQVRKHWMPSFGSCSFEDPCDDLRALGLLP